MKRKLLILVVAVGSAIGGIMYTQSAKATIDYGPNKCFWPPGGVCAPSTTASCFCSN